MRREGLSLLRQKRYGDDRAQGRRGESCVAVQGAPVRLLGVDDVAAGARLLFDRLSQSAGGVPAMGVDVPDATGRRATDYGFAGASGVEGRVRRGVNTEVLELRSRMT